LTWIQYGVLIVALSTNLGLSLFALWQIGTLQVTVEWMMKHGIFTPDPPEPGQ
jgi:hypothetical protein